MKHGQLFPETRLTSDYLIPQCESCGLYRSCNSPKMNLSGKGRKEILVVGESPGVNEDLKGVPFIGESGKLLEKTLSLCDVDFRKDCWITNALICRPPDNKIGNKKSIGYCRPNIVSTIEKLKPKVILLLGNTAVESVIRWVWNKEDVGGINRWAGWQIPCQKVNSWLCPTWHPAHILRVNGIHSKLFEKHIREASRLKHRPWTGSVNFQDKIKLVYDSRNVERYISKIIEIGKPTAFDFETNKLKPDSAGSRIISCSLSNGSINIAYPWVGKAIIATKDFLLSKVPKIASNLKFENRWVLKEFGFEVKSWYWDTMIAAHVLDNRPDVTGLKFQSFVLLGLESYDDEVSSFFESSNSNKENNIREIPLHVLLLYNGLDAFLEWKIARIQKKKIYVKKSLSTTARRQYSALDNGEERHKDRRRVFR